MWILRKRVKVLEKKVADLEIQVQSQQEIMVKHMNYHEEENRELKDILSGLKQDIYNGIAHTL